MRSIFIFGSCCSHCLRQINLPFPFRVHRAATLEVEDEAKSDRKDYYSPEDYQRCSSQLWMAPRYVHFPANRKRSEMIRAACKLLFVLQISAYNLRAFVIQFFPISFPVFLVSALDSRIRQRLIVHALHLVMRDRHRHHHRLVEVFHLPVPHLANLRRSKRLRRTGHFNLDHSAQEFKLVVIFGVTHIRHCFFPGHGAIHDCHEDVLSVEDLSARRQLKC